MVDSPVGKESTFTLYLPAAAAEAGAPGIEKGTAATAPALRVDGGPHFLYLDDDDALVYQVERLLERRGKTVSNQSEPVHPRSIILAAICCLR